MQLSPMDQTCHLFNLILLLQFIKLSSDTAKTFFFEEEEEEEGYQAH